MRLINDNDKRNEYKHNTVNSDRRSPNFASNSELEKVIDESRWARWFWAQGTSATWSTTKILITFLSGLFICIIGMIGICTFFHSPYTAGVIGGLLLAITLASNAEIRRRWNTFVSRRRSTTGTRSITHYENFRYYFLEGRDEILFVEQGTELSALGVIRIISTPIGIKGNMEHFFRGIYEQQLPVWYTITVVPLGVDEILDSPAITDNAREHYQNQSDYDFLSKMESHGGIWHARVLIGTRRSLPISMWNVEVKRMELYQQVSADLVRLKDALRAAYPHLYLGILKGQTLEKAIAINLTGGGIPAFF